jgi:hypothetical protein
MVAPNATLGEHLGGGRPNVLAVTCGHARAADQGRVVQVLAGQKLGDRRTDAVRRADVQDPSHATIVLPEVA